MSYTPDAVLAKLSALNESHDSIATAAQWIMFHRRHADSTVQLWLQRLKDSPSPKRLNLIYLANEVTQQSKARHKDDFLVAFSPVIAEATATAYKGAPTEIQAKLRRVVDVWRERRIFEQPIQAAIEARIEELDKARGAVKSGFGGSIFGAGSMSATGSLPTELKGVVDLHATLTKHQLPLKSSLATANSEYEKLTDPANSLPAAPVYAARLNGLLKHLASAESAVAESVKARQALVAALEKVLSTHRQALQSDEEQQRELASRKESIEKKKQEVELEIMRNLSTTEDTKSPAERNLGSPAPEPDRPEVEALTPPPVEALTPPDVPDNQLQEFYEPPAAPAPKDGSSLSPAPPSVQSPQIRADPVCQSSAPGIEMLSNLASQYPAVPVSVNGSNKRRRVDSDDDFPDLGGDDGIEPDVAEILRKDSHGS
ncbi:hypothetical protein VTK73DRAFT_8126 [Phialemonium thermophilum]|uniref:CID domain-containing protein n=1 Tax=Phialemonium thermophilum TaxID=223376 RepID=A0ABR3XQR5_9PEZI